VRRPDIFAKVLFAKSSFAEEFFILFYFSKLERISVFFPRNPSSLKLSYVRIAHLGVQREKDPSLHRNDFALAWFLGYAVPDYGRWN